jgi:hypothetical protein
MVTNAAEDFIPSTVSHFLANIPRDRKPKCKESLSYCGILSELYPDKKPMGYPFDRSLPAKEQGTSTLDDFIAQYSNMSTTEVTIRHNKEKLTKVHKKQPSTVSNTRPTRSNSSGSSLASDWSHVDRFSDIDSLSDDNFS